MAELNETPSANRIRIAFFGLRNAGKSTLVNAFTGQPIAIVSEVAGTTTDPVSKAMEILPLGPCLITDTAGLDDEGALGELRVKKSLEVLATTDIAIWVGEGFETWAPYFKAVTVLKYQRGESVEALKAKVAELSLANKDPGLLDGLIKRGDKVLCVCPIDESAPKGRLILPQVQVIRECLDLHATCLVAQPDEIPNAPFDLIITDSQAFSEVSKAVSPNAKLTSFSILFARQKGDLSVYLSGLNALKTLKDGDTVVIAEGCTHHRQCNDIGSVKIPKAVKKLTGKDLNFVFLSGGDFTLDDAKLIVQCGGCMLTRKEVLRRIKLAKDEQIPIVNYGMVLAAAAGLDLERVCKI